MKAGYMNMKIKKKHFILLFVARLIQYLFSDEMMPTFPRMSESLSSLIVSIVADLD